MVWIGMVSHCITWFLPTFFWISVLRCATKTKKNRRSTAKCYRIGLWTARWQDPHHIFPRSSRLIRSQSSMLGTWKIPTYFGGPKQSNECPVAQACWFWDSESYMKYESWMCCLERIWTNFKNLFVNLRIEDTLSGQEQPVPTRPDSCRHLENGVCVLVRRRRLHCRWVGLPLPKIRLSAVEASEVR
jgi:hypothetical protein